MAAVHCITLHCMCEPIAGIRVEIHGLAHALPPLRIDSAAYTNLYFKRMYCPRATSTLGIPQWESKVCCVCSFSRSGVWTRSLPMGV